MKYDGVVIRFDQLFLFLLDPETKKLQDGKAISDHERYSDLTNEQLMVVSVEFKDGTKDVDVIDLYDFVHGDKYGVHNIFIKINDVLLYSISEKNSKLSLLEIAQRGELGDVAVNCIMNSKEQMNSEE